MPATRLEKLNLVSATMRCRYKTGTCRNERSRKTATSLHSLCEMHRQMHNFNQRKFDRKKRAMRDTLRDNEPLDVSYASSEHSGDDDDGPCTLPLAWSDEDLSILRALFVQ
ncbi:Aste57867_20619 [Aphanomyces stellatus]|uniref:Aste57867_20619 protein n=1 Tax=Aphanomyces stellatus TaxID=120398 RepID=A0A485LFC4_9STRA|nr:hypothetical protein As57867_020551 [Aphanomyces stellatus]VFT97299.1 Aste57867_20619 [Aphanomyces stellatus]